MIGASYDLPLDEFLDITRLYHFFGVLHHHLSLYYMKQNISSYPPQREKVKMTERQMKQLQVEEHRRKSGVPDDHHIDNILNDNCLKSDRIKARSIYREILFFQHDPKEKKELWRRLGKCLSLNDFEFEVGEGQEPLIKSVSSIKLEGNNAQTLSVDFLRSLCATLQVRNSGRLKKNELIKVMSEVAVLVRSKLTAIGVGFHEKVQELIWLEDLPRGWDVPPKTPLSKNVGSAEDGGTKDENSNKDMDDGSNEGESSGYTIHNS